MSRRSLNSPMKRHRGAFAIPALVLALGALAPGCVADAEDDEYEVVAWHGDSADKGVVLGPGPVLDPRDEPDPAPDLYTAAQLKEMIHGGDASIARMEAHAEDARTMFVHDPKGELTALANEEAPQDLIEAQVAEMEALIAGESDASERAGAWDGPIAFLADITGTNGDDNLDGTSERDNINGLEGNDTINGLGDNDNLIGGLGSDTLNGGEGNDYLQGGAEADSLNGGNGKDTAAYTGSGELVNVSLASGSGSGGDAEGDTLSGIEVLRGSNNDDTLTGDSNNNELYGGNGNDTLRGGDGNDSLIGGVGADSMDGGAGDGDYVLYIGADTGVSANLGGTGAGGHADGDTYSGIENIRGGNHDDTLTGDGGNNSILGASGNDVMNGGGGNDYFIGHTGGDTHNGGAGHDTASWAASPSGVTANLANGTASGGHADGDSLSGIEALRGSNAGGDNFTGDDNDNDMLGSGGNDTLRGAGGDDALLGGDDTDTLEGGDGDDTLNGGDGSDSLDFGTGDGDVLSYEGAPSPVTIDIGSQSVSGGGSHGGDSISGTFEGAVGTANDGDVLTGDAQPNMLRGGLGADTLNGGDERDTVSYSDHFDDSVNVTVNGSGAGSMSSAAGNDSISNVENVVGGQQNDNLNGDGGRNTLSGRYGNDTIDGGGGEDTISFEGREESFSINLNTGQATTAGETDTFSNIENIVGGEGNDTLTGDNGPNVLDGKEGGDALNGGGGKDIAAYTEAEGGVTVDLLAGSGSRGDAAGDTYSGIEDLRGSDDDDIMSGDDNVNTILTAEGNDELYGNDGNDFLVGGPGADRLDGGPGADQANYAPSQSGVTVDLAAGGSAPGDADGDTYFSIENIRGSEHADNLRGDSGPNVIVGANGNDTINGAGGNDAMLGSRGDDTFVFTDDGDTDTVVGFKSNGDADQLNVFTFYSTFGDVQMNLRQSGSHAIIDLPMGGQIRLYNFTASTLSAGDFIFASPLAPPATAFAVPAEDHIRRSLALRHYAVRPLSARETLDELLA